MRLVAVGLAVLFLAGCSQDASKDEMEPASEGASAAPRPGLSSGRPTEPKTYTLRWDGQTTVLLGAPVVAARCEAFTFELPAGSTTLRSGLVGATVTTDGGAGGPRLRFVGPDGAGHDGPDGLIWTSPPSVEAPAAGGWRVEVWTDQPVANREVAFWVEADVKAVLAPRAGELGGPEDC